MEVLRVARGARGAGWDAVYIFSRLVALRLGRVWRGECGTGLARAGRPPAPAIGALAADIGSWLVGFGRQPVRWLVWVSHGGTGAAYVAPVYIRLMEGFIFVENVTSAAARGGALAPSARVVLSTAAAPRV